MHQKYIPEHADHSTRQSSIGAAYRISDFPCFADNPHKLLMDSILSYYFGRKPFPPK